VTSISRSDALDRLRPLGLSRQSLRRILRRGDRRFWHLAGRTVWLRSPARVCRALGIERVRDGELMSLEDLTAGSLGEIRARLSLRAIARIRRERPTSNTVASSMLNVTMRTVRTYRKRSGVATIRSFEPVVPYAPLLWRAYRTFRGPRYQVIDLDGRRWIAKQIGNVLACRHPRGRVRTYLRRINGSLRTPEHPGGDPNRSRGVRCVRRRRSNPSTASYIYRGSGVKAFAFGDRSDVFVFVAA
jgi:hypothetical protein